MKRKNITKTKNVVLILSILTSVAFPAGIVGTILGAVNHLTFILVLGIIATVLGFFGLPFVWLGFAGLVTKNKIWTSIVKHGVTDINTLAQIHNKQPQEIRDIINSLISKGYLEYTLLYDKIEKDVTANTKCPNCGAPLTESEEKFYCPYCKATFKK